MMKMCYKILLKICIIHTSGINKYFRGIKEEFHDPENQILNYD